MRTDVFRLGDLKKDPSAFFQRQLSITRRRRDEVGPAGWRKNPSLFLFVLNSRQIGKRLGRHRENGPNRVEDSDSDNIDPDRCLMRKTESRAGIIVKNLMGNCRLVDVQRFVSKKKTNKQTNDL